MTPVFATLLTPRSPALPANSWHRPCPKLCLGPSLFWGDSDAGRAQLWTPARPISALPRQVSSEAMVSSLSSPCSGGDRETPPRAWGPGGLDIECILHAKGPGHSLVTAMCQSPGWGFRGTANVLPSPVLSLGGPATPMRVSSLLGLRRSRRVCLAGGDHPASFKAAPGLNPWCCRPPRVAFSRCHSSPRAVRVSPSSGHRPGPLSKVLCE